MGGESRGGSRGEVGGGDGREGIKGCTCESEGVARSRAGAVGREDEDGDILTAGGVGGEGGRGKDVEIDT